MENSYTNNFHNNMLEMNSWQGNSSNFVPNNPNIPFFIPNTTYNKPVPFYHSPSDPRFKQNTSCDETRVVLKVENIDHKTDDELWIETYLSKIGKININLHSNMEIITPKLVAKTPIKKTLKIHVAKSVLHRCVNLLHQLEKMEAYLKENVATISTTEWKQKTIEIGQQKDEFSGLLSQFDDSSVLEQLHKTLKKRKHKRLLNKQRKINSQKEHAERLKKQEQMHKNLDDWLEKMKEDVERSKQEECMKKDADCILAEVNKKKSDARKQLSLLSALVKLRSAREQTAIANGEKINSEDSNAFKQNLDKLQKMWEKALDTYSLEEQELKVMLANTVASEVHTACSKEKKILKDWESVLFGPKIIPSDAYWGLTCAEKDIRTFIAIRKSWDTFLVTDDNKGGSRIPVGWILPETSNSELPSSENK